MISRALENTQGLSYGAGLREVKTFCLQFVTHVSPYHKLGFRDTLIT